jgi:rhomboid protease GluP
VTDAPPPPAQNAGTPPDREHLRAFGALLRETTPRVRVVPALVIANLGIFVAMVAMGVSIMSPTPQDLLRWGANYGPKTGGGESWRLLANMFLHFGLLHVGLNMLALVNAGGIIERMFGAVRFASLYIVAGLTGSLASVIMQPGVVSAGASGAVFGVYGALGAFLLRQRGVIPPAVLKSLGNVALGFVGYNLLAGFGFNVVGGSHHGIDNAAHIGGLLGGFVCGLLFARPLGPRPAERTIERWWPAALAAGVLALTLVGARLLPVPADFLGAVNAFSRDESRAIDAYNGLVRSSQARTVTDEEYADQIERGVLPAWRDARAHLRTTRPWPKDQRKTVEVLSRYADARERGWTELARALRSHDEAAMRAATAHQDEAAKIMEELKK